VIAMSFITRIRNVTGKKADETLARVKAREATELAAVQDILDAELNESETPALRAAKAKIAALQAEKKGEG
jgi:hypothetical protein